METVPRITIQREAPLDPSYVTGFIEGEGSFTYSRNEDNYNLYFAVKLTAADHLLLVYLQSYFGCGKIYDVKARAPQGYGGRTKAAKLFRITRINDLQRVIKHFDQFPLLGTKGKSYQIWRQMVIEKSKLGKVSKDKLKLLAEELSEQSPRNQDWLG